MIRKTNVPVSAAGSLASDLTAARDRIAAVRTQLALIAEAPATPDEVKASVEAFVSFEIKEARGIFNPAVFSDSDGQDSGLAAALKFHSVGTLAIILGADAIVDVLVREAVAAQIGRKAMTRTQREAETDRLNAQLFAVEVDEEAIIRVAEDAGVHLPRRSDARADLILAKNLEEVR